MPYKFEKEHLKIPRKFDRRVKLSLEDREDIKELHRTGHSQRALARMFGVSRRLIQFIIYPEKLEQALQKRRERGGSKLYYNKEKQREYMKDTRKYKQKLKIQGKLCIQK